TPRTACCATAAAARRSRSRRSSATRRAWRPRSRWNGPDHWPRPAGAGKKRRPENLPMAIKYGRPIGDSALPRPVEGRTQSASAPRAPATRRRRTRKPEWARRMVRENVLTANDLIWPLFVAAGKNTRVPVGSMPGVDRLSVDQAVREAVRAAELDI